MGAFFSLHRDIRRYYIKPLLHQGDNKLLLFAYKKKDSYQTFFDDETLSNWAAYRGYLEILIWVAKNRGCISSFTCTRAAAGGHVKVLIWLIADHWFPTEWVWDAAVDNSRIEVLDWGNANIESFDGRYVLERAYRKRNMEVLKWAAKNGYRIKN